ncbi:MAG TPA: type II toxin-antitoxin system HicA family toxin [Acidimicrobiales bacterium]|nr:type II toxin-antitoxin system HicA family toxin [Acidimicrobiales bacterium]
MPPQFPSLRGRALLKVLTCDKLGYEVVRQRGSHRQLASSNGYPPLTFAFGDNDMIGPTMVKKVLMQSVGLTDEEVLEVL